MTRVAFIVLLATLAPQGRWKEVGLTSSANPVFVDLRSVRRAEGIVSATVRIVYQRPVKVDKKVRASGAAPSARL